MSIENYPCIRHCTKRRIQDNRQLASGICLRRFFIRRFIFTQSRPSRPRYFGLLSAQSINVTHLPPSERESHLSDVQNLRVLLGEQYLSYFTAISWICFCVSNTALVEFIWDNIYKRQPSMRKKTKMGKRLEGNGQNSKSKGKFYKRRYRNWLGVLGQGCYRLPLKAIGNT